MGEPLTLIWSFIHCWAFCRIQFGMEGVQCITLPCEWLLEWMVCMVQMFHFLWHWCPVQDQAVLRQSQQWQAVPWEGQWKPILHGEQMSTRYVLPILNWLFWVFCWNFSLQFHIHMHLIDSQCWFGLRSEGTLHIWWGLLLGDEMKLQKWFDFSQIWGLINQSYYNYAKNTCQKNLSRWWIIMHLIWVLAYAPWA